MYYTIRRARTICKSTNIEEIFDFFTTRCRQQTNVRPNLSRPTYFFTSKTMHNANLYRQFKIYILTKSHTYMAIDGFQVMRRSSNVVVFSEPFLLSHVGKIVIPFRGISGLSHTAEFHVHLSKLYEITLGNDTCVTERRKKGKEKNYPAPPLLRKKYSLM
jgi:hypothetical protein